MSTQPKLLVDDVARFNEERARGPRVREIDRRFCARCGANIFLDGCSPACPLNGMNPRVAGSTIVKRYRTTEVLISVQTE